MKEARSVIADRLRRYVSSLKKSDELSRFIEELNRDGEAFLFGGAARDVAFGEKARVGDLDIVVSGKDLDSMLGRSSARRNNFGGYRLRVAEFDVDVWEIPKSYAFRTDSAFYSSLLNLLKSVCFSTDAVSVSLLSGRATYLKAFEDSFSDRRLDFVVPPAKLDALVATRLARLVLKLGLELTPSVASYFSSAVDAFGEEALIDADSRWGGMRFLNEISVPEVRAVIRHSIDKAYRARSTGGRLEEI